MKEGVTIIIPNYNTEKDTIRCLKSMEKTDYRKKEILIIENGSTQESGNNLKKQIQKIKTKARIIQLPKNAGYTGAINTGTRKAKYNLVISQSNDTTVNKDYIKELVKTITKNKNVALVNPKIINKEKAIGSSSIGTISITGLNNKIEKNENLSFINGCAFMFKKNMVKEPFDESYVSYGEDNYLSFKSLIRGFKFGYAKKAVLTHGSYYLKNRHRNKEQIFHFTKNSNINCLIFLELKNVIKTLPLVLTQNLLLLTAPLMNKEKMKKEILIKIKAYFWLIKNFKKIMDKRKEMQKLRKLKDKDLKWAFTAKQPYFKGKPGEIINKIILTYCKITNLPVREK